MSSAMNGFDSVWAETFKTSWQLEIHRVASVRNENVGPKAGFSFVDVNAEVGLLGTASVAVFVT